MTGIIEKYEPRNRVRILTATSLFDGHDASINIMRRIMQSTGVEVIHLGHNRSAAEIVNAAIEEDVQGIAVSSYQGGHIEFFKYIIDLLKKENAGHIKVFGGGGGVIVPDEIRELHAYGVARIYSPEDGARMGLQGMINHMVQECDYEIIRPFSFKFGASGPEGRQAAANLISAVQNPEKADDLAFAKIREIAASSGVPVVGITGTGGAGKSSLTDELLIRMLNAIPALKVAVICCDPSRRKTGGALLGDRIRMNSADNERVFIHSLATRKSNQEVPEALGPAIEILKASSFDLIIAETAGIGQGNSRITEVADVSIYVMTAEFGAASQLEKIDMLDYADIVVINKFDKKGSEDALRDVRKQVQRNRGLFELPPEKMPVFGTIASKFNDSGVTDLYRYLAARVLPGRTECANQEVPEGAGYPAEKGIIIPSGRSRYLAEISGTVRNYHRKTETQRGLIRLSSQLRAALEHLRNREATGSAVSEIEVEIKKTESSIEKESLSLLKVWDRLKYAYREDELSYEVRGRTIKEPLTTGSLAGLRIPKVSLPSYSDPADIYSWLRRENLPGCFPYTAGVFPLKRTAEDPTRMFAGEGDPFRTNKRFKFLSSGYEAKRLSTAFDSVTLYGFDPDRRPDIYGKIGTSGVSVCTIDDVKALYSGFDLCSPLNSVSMTINGPAPVMLAMFLNTAVEQQADEYKKRHSAEPGPEEYARIKKESLEKVRGTVQADILKEDQGQNTCIFSVEFALKMMGDIQEYFIKNNVRNFYSVSVSGYHIAEAGANPITQLAFTLANGFTYVEYYLSRGMEIDSFAQNFSFFFSNGMDPEYTVIGRVARRIWAVAMKEKYGAGERASMLKYHIQTSGRSLHSQEIQFNDIRTTLQALCAVYDNCSSLHTNAYDEAVTTPSDESVRRALAIQMIINREWGPAKCENFLQGSFIVEELTELVEEAVLLEFDKISERGGVLGAMETGYQRSRIQDESLLYENLKHSGGLPIIGVNTFLNKNTVFENIADRLELSRATAEEKESQLSRLVSFKKRNSEASVRALAKLREVTLVGGNIFEELLETVKFCSLGQICAALYEAGGRYRRNM